MFERKKNAKLTEDQKQIIREEYLQFPELSIKELAKRNGNVCGATITNICKDLANRCQRISEERKNKIIQDYINCQDLTVAEIGELNGVHESTVNMICRKNNVESRNREFTENEELEICKEYILNEMGIFPLCRKWRTSREVIYEIIMKFHIPERYQYVDKTKLIGINEDYFEKIDTPYKAWLLGWIASDGSIEPNSTGNGFSLVIGLKSTDDEILKELINVTGSDHTIKYRTCTTNGKEHYICKIVISRQKICRDLMRHGIGPYKSKKMDFPNLPKWLMKYYIRGVVEGDGSFCLTPNINKNGNFVTPQLIFSFVSPIYDYILKFQNYLVNECDLNNDNTIQPIKSQKNENEIALYSIHYSGNLQVRKIFEYIYSGEGPFLARKKNLCIEHFKNYDNLPKSKSGIVSWTFNRDRNKLKNTISASEFVNILLNE